MDLYLEIADLKGVGLEMDELQVDVLPARRTEAVVADVPRKSAVF